MKFPWQKKPRESHSKSLSKRQEVEKAELEVKVEQIRQGSEIDRELHKSLVDSMRNEAGLVRQMIIAKYKLKIPESGEDPIVAAKRELIAAKLREDPDLRDRIVEEYMNEQESGSAPDLAAELSDRIAQAALMELESNPELLKEAARKRIQKTIGDRNTGSPLGQVLDELDSYDELRERIGGEQGRGGGLLSPETIQSILKAIPYILGKGGQQQTYVVETSQGLVEMEPAVYKQYLQEKERALPSAKTSQQETTQKPQATVEPSISVDVSQWATYFHWEPSDVIADLKAREDPQAKFVLNMLRTRTVEQILALLRPFENSYPSEIAFLNENREWLGKLTVLAKGETLSKGETP